MSVLAAALTAETFLLFLGAGMLVLFNEGERYNREAGAAAVAVAILSGLLFAFMLDGAFFLLANNPFMHAFSRFASLGVCIAGAFGVVMAYRAKLPLQRRCEALALFTGGVSMTIGIYESVGGWSTVGGTVLFFIVANISSGLAAGAITLGAMHRWSVPSA